MRTATRAELIKLLSLKNSRRWLLIGLLAAIAVQIIQSIYLTQQDGAARLLRTVNAGFELISGPGATVLIVVALVLGTMTVSSEYAGHTMRATVVGAPSRLLIVQAKVIATVVVMGLLAIVYVAVAMLSTFIALSTVDTNLPLSDVTVWRSALGVALVVAVFGAVGVGVGFVFKQVGASAFAAIALVFVAIPTLGALREQTVRYLPLESARRVMSPDVGADAITAWTSAALLITFALVVCAVGGRRFNRADQ
jgi:ABC-2 type transport system permease protein